MQVLLVSEGQLEPEPVGNGTFSTTTLRTSPYDGRLCSPKLRLTIEADAESHTCSGLEMLAGYDAGAYFGNVDDDSVVLLLICSSNQGADGIYRQEPA